MQTLLSPPVTKPKKPKKPRKPIDFNFNFSGLVDRLRLGPQESKVAVIIFFTVCWMLVAVVRSYAPHDAGAPETSSLMSLAKLFKQGAISGRDFQSTFGPGMQFLAWAAVSITTAGSPVDAYGIIAFFFSVISAVLIAVMLLVCDRISWLDSAIVYAFCFFLNLFFGILDFRMALLLLSAVLAYRITAAEDTSRQLIWATATGLVCFVSQLVSFELVIYEVLVIASALAASWLLSRDAGTFLGIEVLVATLAGANVGLVFLFKLTSANYAMAFDYQNYSLEILRGYHNTMGVLWQLSSLKTAVLFLGVSFAITACIIVARGAGLLEAPLYFSLALAAAIWVKTGFVRSDTPHIVAAFTPMVVVLAILATRVWHLKPLGVAWAVAVLALLFMWPSFNVSAPLDVFHMANGQVPVSAAVRNIFVPRKRLESSLLPKWTASDPSDQNASILMFPYDSHVGVAMGHHLVAPVLESYAAGTDSLEKYYLQALEGRMPGSLEVVYGLDGAQMGGIQAIARTPRVFEYIYQHFESTSGENYPDGRYKLHPRHSSEATLAPFALTPKQQTADRGELTLATPSTCGLLQLQVRLDYAKNTVLFRPSGFEMRLSDGDQQVWQGTVGPIETNREFVTYISPLPPEAFHQVFSQGPIRSRKWNKIEYWPSAADPLGAAAEKVRIEEIQCLDPQKYVDATPGSPSVIAQ